MRVTHVRKSRPVVLALLAIIVFVAMLALIHPAYAATSSYLSVVSSGNVLAASRNNTLSVDISNVGKYVRELDITLTIPPPLVLFGDNHWIRASFLAGDMIRANLTIFAPSSAAGSTLQGNIVAVYKVIGETIPSTETHMISFLVRGWIDIKVYEITVSPDPALPGSETTISGNILNRGVIPAMYTNVSISPDWPLMKDFIKPTYVGQVDPNAPAPFSVTAVIDPKATEGSYQATILVLYRDDLQMDQAVEIPIRFSVVAELPKTQTAQPGIVEQLMSGQLLMSSQFLFPAVVVLIIIIVIGIYLRRRRRASES